MPQGRIQKSIKNALYSLIAQIMTILLNFIARVKFVSVLGGDVNGLNGLFTEIMAMLSLAELGFGVAITYSLYKPLAVDDRKKVSQIMWLYKTVYRTVAAVVLAMGLVCLPFIHLTVTGTDFSLAYIRRIFLLFVLRTVSTYLMAYKTSLFTADQKSYVVSAINAGSKIIGTAASLISLYLFGSFEAFLIVGIVCNLLTNLCVTICSARFFPYLSAADHLPKAECREILSNIRHIFIGKVSGIITNSTDNVLISVLVSTASTGVFSNYSMIMNNVKQLFSQIMNAVTGSFGNLMASESPERCEKTLRNLNFMFFSFGVVLGNGLICASAPFMTFFFGEQFLLDDLTLFVCSLNMCLSIWILPLWRITDVSGLFQHEKWIAIAGSTLNLIVSLVLGRWLGMAGIFIGTTCTYLVQMLLKIGLLYRHRFHTSAAAFYFQTGKMFLLVLLLLLLEQKIAGWLTFNSPIVAFLACGTLSVAISAAVILIFYAKSSEFQYFCDTFGKLVKGRKTK